MAKKKATKKKTSAKEKVPEQPNESEVEEEPVADKESPEAKVPAQYDPQEILQLIEAQQNQLKEFGTKVSEALTKTQAQNQERIADFDKRLENLEQSVLKVVDLIKGVGAEPGAPLATGEVVDQAGMDKLVKELGPFAPFVVNALKPEDPFATIGRSIVNNQIKQLTDPNADPVRKIGQSVVDEITNKGISNLFHPVEDEYQKTYMKTKAKLEAERDVKGG